MPTEFNPEMLVLARESRGLTQTELADLAVIQQGTISKIESGVLSASPEIVERFAKSLRYPRLLFYQSDRIYGFNSTVFFHRKRQSLSDRVLRSLHAFVNLTRMRVARLLRATEISIECRFQHIEPTEYLGRIDRIAQLVRSTWRLPLGPVRHVMDAIENAGGVVVAFDFGTRQVDAISEWVIPHPPLFVVNSNAEITGDRLRMTLAHELGHIIMHRFPSADMEKQANLFASEFLMPRKEIKSSLFSLNWAKLLDLKAHWKVSMAAIVQRAHELGTITDSQRQYQFMQFSNRGYRTREPEETDIAIERPTLLNELIQAHLKQLGYSPSDLATLMLLEEDEFRASYLETKRLQLVG
jgi:Zn-dependent peptidase ImmA (M78 family)/DNA-binding XRE family transcriptional regulator